MVREQVVPQVTVVKDQVGVHIIPVIDERLGYASSASKAHKDKVERYNDLLEEIYEHELELAKMKSALVDMRKEIVEDAQSLDGVAVGVKAVQTDGIVNGDTSDNDSIDKEKKDRKRGGRGKAIVKGKGKEKSKVAGTEMDVEWDYNLELSNSAKRGRRASDASDSVEPPTRNAFVLGSH